MLPARPVVLVGTWLKCIEFVVATRVSVIAIHRYIPFPTLSILPVHRELAPIVPSDKSKFTYQLDIAPEVNSCNTVFSPAFA